MNERNLIFKLLVLVLINISLMAITAPDADALGDNYTPRDGFRADTNYRGRGGDDPAIYRASYGRSGSMNPMQTPDLALPLCECRGCRAGYRDFGMRPHPIRGGTRLHAGCDLAAPTGTPIYAPADGVVARAGSCGSYGNFISIAHGRRSMTADDLAYAGSVNCGQAVRSGYSTNYGHLSRIRVRQGQFVRKGQLIGYVGSTGGSTGPHLHYEVRLNGRPTNPEGAHGYSAQITSASLQRSCNDNFRGGAFDSPGMMVMNKWLSEVYM